ncbi:MAG: type II toxin-antitoxin system HicB family antitoxin [Solobacterium sp.]|nr:type II toxin-antitoxin system HicB family antitoxin [Solobacterium sp.]MDD5983401.1 type II toxin-antitoxin system HicB family antitoxin [Solobacterium sp.]MDD6122725.1 type II toxin-antitoxin system HicB family antitoxin [Solobacterium sp.]MDD6497847.1 type II toxin-antitoxin system HicB family antitoxin [Solobacterium sp.]MDD6835005.1 type II toxin-antitoxin system HicB family antitoxin [Solobacterium sp.]
MKDINYYMSLPYKMELTPDTLEGGYVVSFPDLPGCLTVGETIEEAIRNA